MIRISNLEIECLQIIAYLVCKSVINIKISNLKQFVVLKLNETSDYMSPIGYKKAGEIQISFSLIKKLQKKRIH